jgi:hypothetical protein
MNARMIRIAASLALSLTTQLRAAEIPLPKDGWVSWQVDAVENAPAWCCWSGWEDRAEIKSCQLDGERLGFGPRDHGTTDSVRVYARLAGGKVERLRALAAACPVEAKTPILKLDNVSTDDSARWLMDLTRQDKVDNEVLAALAMHRGDFALDALRTMARDDARMEYRKQAIFWLAMLRGTAGADIAIVTMFNDKDPAMRKHAAFATAQSKSARVAENLIRQGNTDTDGDVRAQAWFWLAHSGAVNAEQAIGAALRKDPDDHVREQAVFALSQLPDERATRALIAAAEDRSLTREQRKRAVFWLAQSKSDEAQAYLQRVLTGSVTQ